MLGRMRYGLLAGAGGLVLAACGGNPGDSADVPASPSSSGAGLSGTVTIFAAASLTGSFEQIGAAFEAANPDLTVTFNFGASSALAQQIVSGAPADVFAAASAASPATMATVTEAGKASDVGEAGEPQVFVRNRLQIAVPPANPGKVTGLADFARTDLTIALCAEQVPCGAAAAKVFSAARIVAAPDTLEQDVKAVLSKVQLGEVDAALVYRTDVLAAAGKVKGIAFQEADDAVNDYPIAALTSAPNASAAKAFVAYVLSPEGQEVLADAGFDSP